MVYLSIGISDYGGHFSTLADNASKGTKRVLKIKSTDLLYGFQNALKIQ